VDFELTRDQEELQAGVRKLLNGRFPREQVRALESTGGVDRPLWSELDDAGVFSLRRPEADGGAGLGLADTVLVFEELGRALVPGPLVATHLAVTHLTDASDAIWGLVDWTAAPHVVEHLAQLDRLVVLDGDTVTIVAAREVSGAAVANPLDPLTPVMLLAERPAGVVVGDATVAAQLRIEGAVLTAALLLGMAAVTTELAVAYALEREQFGRPIGSFQAVKHILADMLTRAETARAAVYAAGVTGDDPTVGDPARAAAVAKIVAGDAAVANGKACIQVHGGMGFTWEVDAHLYLKRAWVLETQFGGADDHADALAHRMAGGVARG